MSVFSPLCDAETSSARYDDSVKGRRMKNTRMLGLLAAGMLLTVGLSACTGAEPEATPSASASAATTPAPVLDPVLELDDEVGARDELSDFVCAGDGGTWKASGTVTNSTEAAATYVVNIGVIESESRSSLVRRNVVLEVEAGEAVDFTEDELLADAPESGVECVVRVNRGTAVSE